MIEVAVRTTFVFALAALLNRVVFHRASAALRHSIWMLAFVAVPFVLLLPAVLPASAPTITLTVVTSAAGGSHASSTAEYISVVWLLGWAALLVRLLVSYALFSAGCPSVPGPLTFGLIRPRVFLPESAANWDPELRVSVTLHEEAHVQRRDTLAQFFAQLVCAAVWFQPLAWYAARRAAEERERACDDLVLGAGVSPVTYAEHLLHVARESPVARTAALAMVRHSPLEDRLKAILDRSTCREAVSRTFRVCSLLAAAACIFGVSILSGQDRVYSIGEEGVEPPSLTHDVAPTYTDDAREARVTGEVVLSLHINKKGDPENVQVVSGLHPGLDKNAVAALKQWRFDPATKDGQPVVCAATVRIRFNLL